LGTTPFSTVTTEAIVNGAVQDPFGYTLYWTVPPAWKKLLRVEESVTLVPTTGVVVESVVAIVGLALVTVSGSQGDVAGLFPVSPE
jgi:hypothetical protein